MVTRGNKSLLAWVYLSQSKRGAGGIFSNKLWPSKPSCVNVLTNPWLQKQLKISIQQASTYGSFSYCLNARECRAAGTVSFSSALGPW